MGWSTHMTNSAASNAGEEGHFVGRCYKQVTRAGGNKDAFGRHVCW